MIITVTSAYSGEGKSTVLKQRAEANKDKKVIVMDLDVYNPVLGERFNVKADGIIEYLNGKELNIVSVNGIKFIPCSKSKKTLNDVLNDSKFTDLLKTLSNEYDEVYIDAPPVCATPDVKTLFNLCDGVIVVNGGVWNVYTEMRMKKELKDVNVIETVNNKIPNKFIRR